VCTISLIHLIEVYNLVNMYNVYCIIPPSRFARIADRDCPGGDLIAASFLVGVAK